MSDSTSELARRDTLLARVTTIDGPNTADRYRDPHHRVWFVAEVARVNVVSARDRRAHPFPRDEARA